MRRAIIVMLVILWPSLSKAASVRVAGINATGSAVVWLSGQIDQGDALRFLAATAKVRDAVIVLDSPGGLLSDGLTIARIVNARGFTTVVQPGKVCASMCAVVWLAGRRRTMEDGARIGFHAAAEGKSRIVSSSGNAIVGAYLNSLGFSFEAVAYATAAAPKSVSWLTRAKAADLSIEISPLSASATQVTGPPALVASLDVVAVVHTRTVACERQVMEDVWRKGQAGKADVKSYIFLNGRSLNENCKNVEPGANVVIREADPSILMVCAEPAEGQRCLWIALATLRVDPSRSAWAAPVPLAQRDDAAVCRLAILPSGRGWDGRSWSAVQEADRRGLRLEACLSLLGYAAPAPLPASLAQRDNTAVCRLAILPSGRGWDGRSWSAVQEADRRGLRLEACLSLLGYPASAAEAALVPARRAPLPPDAFGPAVAEVPASDIAACREALKQGWPDSTEAQALRARGLARDRCRSGVMLADAFESKRAAPAVSGPVAERDTPSVCYMAMNPTGTAWDMALRAYMNEALRRGLTIPSCRAALVCSTVAASVVNPQVIPLACKPDLSNEPVEVICAAALSDDRQSWTEDPLFGYAVAEVERRKLTQGDCRALTGLPSPSADTAPSRKRTPSSLNITGLCLEASQDVGWAEGPAADALRTMGVDQAYCIRRILVRKALDRFRAEDPRPASIAELDNDTLCLMALDRDGENWDRQSVQFVLEVRRRRLGLQQCRAIIVCRPPGPSLQARELNPLACQPDLAMISPDALCRAALGPDRRDWTADPVLGFSVGEVIHRGLSLDDCTRLATTEKASGP